MMENYYYYFNMLLYQKEDIADFVVRIVWLEIIDTITMINTFNPILSGDQSGRQNGIIISSKT